MTDWIRVEDDLPLESSFCLVLTNAAMDKWPRMMISAYVNSQWCDVIGSRIIVPSYILEEYNLMITHWRDLPDYPNDKVH